MTWNISIKRSGLTLLEMVIAIAIMTVIFMTLLPQFKNIKNSWDSKQANAEMIQNGRVLTEFLNRNLAKAVRIIDVSNPQENNGYIEFMDNAGTTYRCQVNAGDYIEFGPVGDLSELAGPVSRLQFSCYALGDLDTTTTAVQTVRFVKVETTFTDPRKGGQNKDFAANVYLQTNWNSIISLQKKGNSIEFDPVQARDIVLIQVDANHYLCVYSGTGDDGYAVVLTVDTGTGDITVGTGYEFDIVTGKTAALSRIDATHYLCAYQGTGTVGDALVLTIDTGDWTVSGGTVCEFDSQAGKNMALCKIDATHHLCAYQGEMDDGYALVLTVNTGTWEITAGSALEYDTQDGKIPSLAQIDGTHYICAYEGSTGVGKAILLIVDTGDWSLSKKSPHTFDSGSIVTPDLCAIDGTHHLCVWQGYADNQGRARVLTVDDTTWTISSEELYEFGYQVSKPDLAKVDSQTFLCAYGTQGDTSSVVALSINLTTYEISAGESYDFDENSPDPAPDLCQVDETNYLCCYTSDGEDGWSVMLSQGIRP